MTRTSFGLALASLLVLSGGAFADQMYFASPGSTVWNGVYVNPYTVNDLTNPQFDPLTVYCDDWNTEFSGNPTWTANIYALTASNVPSFKYGTATGYVVTDPGNSTNQLSAVAPGTVSTYDLYLEEAWLDEQSAGASGNTQMEYAAAAWLLFVDAGNVAGLVQAINNSDFADAVFTDLTNAQNAVKGGYAASGWDVIVPVGNNSNGGPMQEFLVRDQPGLAVPDPSTVILLGTVAGWLGLTRLRRNRHA
jgi:hypothetical protein